MDGDARGMMCQFEAESLRCSRCGFQAKRLPTYRVCRTVPELAKHLVTSQAKNRIRVPPLRIGSGVKAALTSVGITEKRISKLIGGKPCGCAGRANALDRLGAGASMVVERAANAVLNAVVPANPQPDEIARVANSLAEHPGLNDGLREKSAS